MRKIELVIFDCDGVLLDSELISCECAVAAFQSVGFQTDTHTVFTRFLGIPRRDMVKQIAAEGYSIGEDFTEKLEHSIVDTFEHRLYSIRGIEDALSRLALPRCVISSSPVSYVRRGLELTKLSSFFEPHIFSASMVKRGKPAADLFLYAAKEMGAAPENCLVIEDASSGIEAANAAGMPVFWFLGGSHIDLKRRPPDLVSKHPNRTFNSMSDLPDLIDSFRQEGE